MVSVLSKEDRMRVELLKRLVNDYLAGKETFSELPFKIKSLYQSIETLDKETLQNIFDNWGKIEIIYAFMLAENKQILTVEEKREINRCAENIALITEEILEKNPLVTEDLYAWPE